MERRPEVGGEKGGGFQQRTERYGRPETDRTPDHTHRRTIRSFRSLRLRFGHFIDDERTSCWHGSKIGYTTVV